jgi:prolyl-tRNA editing enzyme YbaK/EbsC (Cys-tRNA(Pro) deacylase)
MSLKPSAQKVQNWLSERGLPNLVHEMPDTTRTSEDAAAACGCQVAQIGKSMVFRVKDTDTSVLIITSGVNKVDEKVVARLLSETSGTKIKLIRADADFVRAATGFAIGGVPPIAHAQPAITLIDRDLTVFDTVWCAAGTPNAVFEVTPSDLLDMTGGAVADIKKAQGSIKQGHIET